MEDETNAREVRYRIAPDHPTILMGSDGSVWESREPTPNPNGYMRVTVGKTRHGKRKLRLYVHYLMLRTFVGVRPEGLLCRHLDDNRDNNRLDNLAYGNWQDNADDMVRNGNSSRGSGRHSAKLHESQIPAIRLLASEGICQAEISRRFGVSPATISEVVRGVTWKHVTDGHERPWKIPE